MTNKVFISNIIDMSDKPDANILVISGTIANEKGQIYLDK